MSIATCEPLSEKAASIKCELLTGLREVGLALGGLARNRQLSPFLITSPGRTYRSGSFTSFPWPCGAWWSGFAHGIFMVLAGAVAWHVVDASESPTIPEIAGIWNGVVRFGTLVLTSSLIVRLHSAILRERLLAAEPIP